jgi:carboxyl-terminal processing protease
MVRRSHALALSALVATVVGIVAFAGGLVVALRWGDTLPLAVTTNQTASAQRTTPSDLQADFNVFWEAWNLVDRKFYHTEPLDRQRMVYGAIDGMLKSLGDDYTVFEDPTAAASTRERISGQFEGIGAYIDYTEGALTIVSPIEESPAEKAGLKAGDIVVRVDSNELAPLLDGLDRAEATRKAANLIRGPKGTTVNLSVLRPSTSETLEFSIVRDAVPLISVRSKMLEGNIAHIQISEFKETTTAELDRTLNEVLAQQPSGIILDMRNNPGGLLVTAQEVLGRFLPDGVALIEEFGDGRTQTLNVQRSSDAPSVFDTPMVVLTNQGSASASEIVAGALRDRGRATLVGEKTFGKGSVQSVERLSDGSSARITIAHWFTPNRTEIHQKGIEPDMYVPFLEDEQYRVELPQRRPADPTEVNDAQLWWAMRAFTSQERPSFPTPTPTSVGAEAAPEETATP